MRACADREETWINPAIERGYTRLHEVGHAHSIECWSGDELAGGLYGVRLGGAFFGESMFSAGRDASKVALAWLVARLRVGHFRLLDCQFMTPHLASLGAVEISRAGSGPTGVTLSMVTPASWKASMRSRTYPSGPQSVMSSQNSSGTAASASLFLPER